MFGCSSLNNSNIVSDDIYFNSKDIAAEKARIAQQKQAQSENFAQKENYSPESEYFDEDYYNKMPVSPYSPIYDPFWGPRPLFSNPGWNTSMQFGYSPTWGSTMGMGLGYTWGNGGMMMSPYNSWGYNPYMMNPYGPGMGMYGNPYWGNYWGQPVSPFWGNFDNANPVNVTPRNNINNYRNDAVNRQFNRSAAQPRTYKKGSNVNFTPQPNTRPNSNNFNSNPTQANPAKQRNNYREIVKPRNTAPPRNNNISPNISAPSRTAPTRSAPNNWSAPSSRPSSTPVSPSRNRRY